MGQYLEKIVDIQPRHPPPSGCGRLFLKGGGMKTAIARSSLEAWRRIRRAISQLTPWPGLTAISARRESAQECEVPDDIEDFMADKFIGVTERLGRQNRIFANHDRIFQTPP